MMECVKWCSSEGITMLWDPKHLLVNGEDIRRAKSLKITPGRAKSSLFLVPSFGSPPVDKISEFQSALVLFVFNIFSIGQKF